MIRFVEGAGNKYRVLIQEADGCWLISYDDPQAPFLVDAASTEGYQRIETPAAFLSYWNRSELSEAEKERLALIRPLLDDEKCISDKSYRLVMAQECASSTAWRDTVGTYQMDATEADIYLVSRFDRSVVIGRP